jgi:hypothetical protein
MISLTIILLFSRTIIALQVSQKTLPAATPFPQSHLGIFASFKVMYSPLWEQTDAIL